jgi:OOP family OmpA-OmpF porin
MLAGGCATKKYVRNTTAPVQAKVDQVGEQANKQGQDIQDTRGELKKVDENARSGISAAQERASTADTHAGEAMTKANQATDMATKNGEQINGLRSDIGNLGKVVANIDDYKQATEVTVPFRFDKSVLTPQAKKDLDTLAGNLNQYKRYFIAIEGFTDKTGTMTYNDTLSRKRADAVAQYLVAKYDVPIYRIHMIGLGSEKPAQEGRTRAARAANRRVEVRLFTADAAMAGIQGSTGTGTTTGTNPTTQR